MRILNKTMLAAVASLAVSSSAAASPVTFQVSGTIDSFTRGGVIQQIPIGSPFLMTMTWDTDTPVSRSTASTATYDGAIVDFFAVAGDIMFVMSPSDGRSTMTVADEYPNDRLLGSVTDSTTTSTDSSLLVWLTRWELLFPSTTLASTDLPTVGPSPIESGLAKLTLYSTQAGHDVTVQATITSSQSVPEPSTLAIFGFGVLGLARWGRRNLNRSVAQ